jgi:hypothetical protein
MRDARRRKKRLRELERERDRERFKQQQRDIPPCPNCGRRAGQMAIIDATLEALAGERDLGAGKPGCPECVDGIVGEYTHPGTVNVLRYIDAPSRAQFERAKLRRRNQPPSYDPRWLEDDEP